MAVDILLKFLIIMTIIFFLPRVINRFTRIPNILIEIFLGFILGMLLPSIFFVDDILQIFSAFGIITLFVMAGLEADTSFIIKRKKFFNENLILHITTILTITALIYFTFKQSIQISLIISLALTTPSASYILAFIKNEKFKNKKWIEGKALIGEIAALFLLVIFLRLQDINLMIFTFAALLALVIILPYILHFFYKKIFSKLIDMEFSLIFVVALISAFVSNYLGLHYLVGAFIAGMISRKFISEIVSDPMYKKANQLQKQHILKSFGFFVMVFIPFYFFSVGLQIKPEFFSINNILIALGLCIFISAIRIIIYFFHRRARIKENFSQTMKISYALLPTLVFTFILAEILKERFNISQELFATLMIYGILSTSISFILIKIIDMKKTKSTRKLKIKKTNIKKEKEQQTF